MIVGYNVFNLLMTNYSDPHQEPLGTCTETPTNDNGLTFREWLRLADRAVSAVCGLGLDDLPDGPSWDAWNDDEAPADYASTMLYDAGFDDQ